MQKYLRLVSIFILALGTAALSGAQEGTGDKPDPKAKTPNYYPLEVGNEWHFRVSVGGNSVNMVSRITKMETIDGMLLARLEASVGDKVAATEHLRQTEQGIFRHRNNTQTIAPPLCLLKYPIKPGSKWEGDLKVGGDKGKYSAETKEETIEVPAGKFKTLRVAIRIESNGQIVNTTYWFVADTGFVKQTVEAGPLNILMELEKFELKKPKDKGK